MIHNSPGSALEWLKSLGPTVADSALMVSGSASKWQNTFYSSYDVFCLLRRVDY